MLDVAIYRVIQEAVTNITKHAHASRVWIEIIYNCGELRCTVRDDGIGVCQNVGGGLGVIGMRERLAHLGGNLELRDAKGGGAELVARVPLARV